jgi:hypothetical protein
MKRILKPPPAGVVKYMRETREEHDADVAIYINRAVAAYDKSTRREIPVDSYIASKLHCTPWQAGRAIFMGAGAAQR